MEFEERPSKMRKLEHESENESSSIQQPESEAKSPTDTAAQPEETSVESTIPEQEIATSQGAVEGTQKPTSEATENEASNRPSDSNENEDPNQPSKDKDNSQTTKPTPSKFEIDPSLSKNQQKKLRKKLEWEAGREERKVLRKEQQKAKRERLRAEKAALPPEVLAKKESERANQPRPRQLPITFLIDCNFDDLMRDGERVSLSSQITRCYSDNKNSAFRAHLVLSSFGGVLKERYDGVLEGVYKLWKPFRTFSENFKEVAEMAKSWMGDSKENWMVGSFAKYADEDQEVLKAAGEIVYLSSEGEEDLTELKPYSTYIIGGLVDKNREKGICYKRAKEAGVKTMRLPIGKFMDMSSRKVLATNHVNEIMVRWLECGDWGESFVKVIPKRKGGTLKGGHGDDDEDDG